MIKRADEIVVSDKLEMTLRALEAVIEERAKQGHTFIWITSYNALYLDVMREDVQAVLRGLGYSVVEMRNVLDEPLFVLSWR